MGDVNVLLYLLNEIMYTDYCTNELSTNFMYLAFIGGVLFDLPS